MSAQPLMIIGGFNIHVDDSKDVYAVEFLDILAGYGLWVLCNMWMSHSRSGDYEPV